MKLKDILTERRNELIWHSDIRHNRKLKILRNFIRSNPGTEVDRIYNNALNTGQLTPEELATTSNIMKKVNWDENDIKSL